MSFFPTSKEASPSSTDAAAMLPGRVLLVDDDAPLRRAYARVISGQGHEVETAEDGADAVRKLESASFDVIVSDVGMPEMDGLRLLRFIRERDMDLPVILMSGAPTVDAAAQAVEQGAIRYLLKPVDAAALSNAVRKALQLHRLARLKRRALELVGGADRQVGDLAGLAVKFDSALSSLWMAFQPIVSFANREVFAYEALLRSGEPALPSPGAVLEAAERLGRLRDLGRRIRERVGATLDQHPDIQAFVNLHTDDLLDESLYSASSPLAAHAQRVVLEITERSTLDGVSDVRDRIAALRRKGYRIAVDDLGAGYAGLSSLAQLEPDIVKLDMTLIRNVHHEPRKQLLVRSLIGACQDMGVHVVAEGIEIPPERDTMLLLGCDLLQGYLFARPERGLPRPVW